MKTLTSIMSNQPKSKPQPAARAQIESVANKRAHYINYNEVMGYEIFR